jgi:vacuolar-type H+-ATPase subunit C/Vma6
LWSVSASLRSSDTTRARHLLGILFDILNLTWIARYRDALGLSPEEIINYTLRPGRWVTLEMRRRLAESRNQPWDVALAGTPYAALVGNAPLGGFDGLATALWRFLALEAQRALVGYPFHIGVPLGLLLTQEIEIRDLRTLFAAQRLGVRAGELPARLVGVRS